jgi:translation elongation factor P/translation initiation factor 5A
MPNEGYPVPQKHPALSRYLVPEDELKEKIAQGKEVSYWVIMGRKMLMEVRGS